MNKFLIVGLVAIFLVASVALALTLGNHSPVLLQASTAQSIFGGSWKVLTNDTYLKVYPTQTVSVYFANGTNVTTPLPHQVKTLDKEVLVGDVNGTTVVMRIQEITYTSNVTFFNFLRPLGHLMHHRFLFNNFNITNFNGYEVVYFSNNVFPRTYLLAIKGNTIVNVELNMTATQQQMLDVLSNLS
ncbi:MAG: zinc ribbon domain-containing protein [Metallosphaera sp.]